MKDKLISAAKTVAANKLNNIFNLPQPDSEVTAYLVLEGKEYELRSFSTEFGQPFDWKGQPQSEIKGGLLHFSLYQLPDNTINRWMFSPNMRKSGEIQFRKKASNIPLRIKFTEAQCISYKKDVGRKDIGFEANLIISPLEVFLNEVMHSNNWV